MCRLIHTDFAPTARGEANAWTPAPKRRGTPMERGRALRCGFVGLSRRRQYMTRSVHLDLSDYRAGTDKEASGHGRCFERIERRGEAPQHRPCARPASCNFALQCRLGWGRVENISYLAIGQPR